MRLLNAMLWTGLGSGGGIIKQTSQTLSKYAKVTEINDASYFVRTNWEDETDLIVFGGGYTSGYIKSLHTDDPRPLKRIKKFIHDGGKYLGFCAGGYFGASRIVFEKGTPLEVDVESPLAILPGMSVGAVYPGFSYSNEENAKVVDVNYENGIELPPMSAYYFGGGEFIPAVKSKIIANYSGIHSDKIAILTATYGKGRSVLMGVHPEVYTHYTDKLDKKLKETAEARRSFFDFLFDTLL